MTISKELLLSILSVDAYNRGYNTRINGLSDVDNTPIAGLKVIKASNTLETSDEVQASFYAIAYEVTDGSLIEGFDTGDVIVTYRGTDEPLFELPGVDREIASRNNFNQDQVHLASKFYLSIADGLASDASIYTAGHSLGGALAGLIGGIYNKEILAVDPIDFVPALENFRTLIARYLAIKDTPNADDDEIILDGMGNQGLIDRPFATVAFAENQLVAFGLSDFNDQQLQELVNNITVITSARQEGYTSFYLSGSTAFLARENDVTFSDPILGDLLPNFGLNVGPIDAHSASLNAIIKYLEQEYLRSGSNDQLLKFRSVFNEAIDSLFSSDVAEFVDENKFVGDGGTKVGVLRDAIAYSALENGSLVLGDTGIRSLFDDFNQLGQIYNAASDDNRVGLLDSTKENLVQIATQYAGALALNQVTRVSVAGGVDGAPGLLDVGDGTDGVFQINESGNLLSLDTSSVLWKDILNATGNFEGEEPLTAIHRDEIIEAFGEPFGISLEILNKGLSQITTINIS